MIQRLIQQTSLNFELYILKFKWLIPIFGTIFISYLAIGSVYSLEQTVSRDANVWDAVFTVFGNIYFNLLVVLLPFVYMLSDLASDAPFQLQMVLKLKNRQEWWLSKAVTLGITALLYVALVAVGVVLVVSVSYPWNGIWSPVAQAMPLGSYITASMLMGNPVDYFITVVLLLVLALFTLGLLAQVGVLIWRSAIAGFTLSAAVIVLGIFAHGWQFRPPLRDLFIPVHLLPFYYVQEDPLRIVIAFLYWITAISLLLVVGLLQSRRVDFIA